ncbi:MAG: helix-turn-helix transcriptional regulator [Variibacter sp.]
MRKTDRLFQIIQILRRHRKPVTAEALAAELETSKRSVYRDIAALIGQRVPIRGEAGIGYVLEGGFDLPPLMLTADEIEAAVLGAQWVAGRADPALARAAQDLIAKIAEAVPEDLRPYVFQPAPASPPAWNALPDGLDMTLVRAAIHGGRKIALRYRDEEGRETQRTVWPVIVGYMDARRLLVAWCELRNDFRNFRTDRVVEAEFLAERYPARPDTLRAQWRKTLRGR